MEFQVEDILTAFWILVPNDLPIPMIILRMCSQADSKQGVNFEQISPRTQKMIPLIKVSLIYFPYFSAMDTTNVQIKKQVFELLSALCVYSGTIHILR